MKKFSILFFSIFFFVFSAKAGEITDIAKQAETLVEDGKTHEGYRKLQEALEIIWQKMPLTIRNTTLAESASGYGLFVPRADTTYKKGDKLLIYTEIEGFGYGRDDIGNRTIGFDVGIILYDDNGKEIFSKSDWVSVGMPVRHKNREFILQLTLNSTSLPAGKYNATLDVRDQNSEKNVEMKISFELI